MITNTRYDSTSITPVKTRGLAGKQTIPRIVISVLQRIFFHFWDNRFLPVAFSTCGLLLIMTDLDPEVNYFILGWAWKATMIIGTFLLAIRNILDIIWIVRTGKIIEKGAR